MGYSYSKRLEVIEQKRQKLERQLVELNQQGKVISARERETKRKEQNRQKYRWGGLIELAGQQKNRTLSDEVLLGALLQVMVVTDAATLERWNKQGAGLLKDQRQSIKESAAAQGYTQADVRSER
ncbi:conjugal transfer protein TraD [Ferriphaselus sp. R-1]|uniref:conjugal transfer protein TraD n=1 Tax=Ferriphaselus sp. R-1 TaxID=1485544 RepID=UPI00054D707D|nr:conjugal transfer protein TraD [Ferriphaselus sp. R-1]